MADHRDRVTDELLRRVHGEFLEMPGLQLTSRQAQRLLGLDERTCSRLLEVLVDARFLYRNGDGMYARVTDGHVFPTPRVAHGSLHGLASSRKTQVV